MARKSKNGSVVFWTLIARAFLLSVLPEKVLAQVPEAQSMDAEEARGFLVQRRWSPYLVGIGIGVLSWLTFLVSNKALGISTAYVRTSGMLERAVRGTRIDRMPYFRKYPPKVDWEWMLVAGVIVGAFLSAVSSGDFRWEAVPSLWQERMGNNALVRWLVALLGGIVMSIGARWARGCTSGHGISGTLQLAVSSWLAVICFFIGGVITAMIIYHGFG
jgi:uncharacterized protein